MDKFIFTFLVMLKVISVTAQSDLECDSLYQWPDTLTIDKFQDTTEYGYSYSGANCCISGGIYIFNSVELSETSIIDSVIVSEFLTDGTLGTYVYENQNYYLSIFYSATSIPTGYTVPATYHIRNGVTGDSCSMNFVFKFTANTMGMDENENSIATLFPNPATDYFQLDNREKIHLGIVSVSGRLIFEKKLAPFEKTDVSQFVPGIYFIELRDGKQRAIKKLVIN